jgi:hypothetical protein
MMQTLYFTTLKASEMDMVVGVRLFLFPAIRTNSEVLLAIIANDLVYLAIRTKAIQDPVNSCSIYNSFQPGLNHIMAQGLS